MDARDEVTDKAITKIMQSKEWEIPAIYCLSLWSVILR